MSYTPAAVDQPSARYGRRLDFVFVSVARSGFMLFVRGFINYSRVRKLADPTYATLPRTRVLFIY